MTPVRIARPGGRVPTITLTPLVDVLLILLVFFMVTSTYLDLDMIPMAEPAETPVETTTRDPEAAPGGAAGTAVLIRLDSAGRAFLAGEQLEGQALTDAVSGRLRGAPGVPVLILPSTRAPTQALVDVLGAVSGTGAERVQVVRFDRPGEAGQ